VLAQAEACGYISIDFDDWISAKILPDSTDQKCHSEHAMNLAFSRPLRLYALGNSGSSEHP
jgi:hypothetical protein